MNIGIYQAYWGPVGGGQRYMGVVAEVLARKHAVEIVHHAPGFDRARAEEAMELDLSAVRFRYVPAAQRPAASTRNPLAAFRRERQWGDELSAPYDLFLNNSDVPPHFCHARRGVLVTHFPLTGRDEFQGRDTQAWRNRSIAHRMLAIAYQQFEWKRRFGTYQLFFCNSHYGQRWLKRRWGVGAEVLYPPLRNGLGTGPKEPMVVSIGAYHFQQHKKHEVLIDAFRRLCDEGLQGWRYVQIGACGPRDEDRAYVDRLLAAAKGYPIEIRTDVSGQELRELLQRASIFWHSMGYGVDPEREPGRLEHFGMVATEAMAAGCVPVVFNGGGLPEIVSHGRNGLLWTTLDELREGTRRVADDAGLRRRLGEAAVGRSHDFSQAVFESRLLHALTPVLS